MYLPGKDRCLVSPIPRLRHPSNWTTKAECRLRLLQWFRNGIEDGRTERRQQNSDIDSDTKSRITTRLSLTSSRPTISSTWTDFWMRRLGWGDLTRLKEWILKNQSKNTSSHKAWMCNRIFVQPSSQAALFQPLRSRTCLLLHKSHTTIHWV